MNIGVKNTDFSFPGQTGKYVGKVRDVYFFKDQLIMIASDRISAFDVVLPHSIPYKGQVLNQIAARFLEATQDIVPNWVTSTPDPNVSIGKKCAPFQIEMVIRGYLAGHAWREYKSGKRRICNISLPDGLKENDELPGPIITPTTKAHKGHDEDISKEEILARELVAPATYQKLEEFTRQLFDRGTTLAKDQGLILVDTKYEFGQLNGEIILIDEIHTPDSSRYFYADTYQELQDHDKPQRQLSKEFVRQWLIGNGFQGKEGQKIPEMSADFIKSVSDRYIELYEHITGERFDRSPQKNILTRIEENILKTLQ